jgi:hypothetical protein
MGLQQDCRQDLNVLARLADSNSSACLHSGRSKELVSRADWRLFWKARHNGTASAELSLAYFLRNVLDFKQRRSKLKFAIIPVGWGRGGGGEWGFRAMLWHRAATAQERNEHLKNVSRVLYYWQQPLRASCSQSTLFKWDRSRLVITFVASGCNPWCPKDFCNSIVYNAWNNYLERNSDEFQIYVINFLGLWKKKM